MPLDTKEAVFPCQLTRGIIDRIEIYKGVVLPAGTDAGRRHQYHYKAGKRIIWMYLVGSFHTHKANLNAQFVEKKNGLIGQAHRWHQLLKNDYRMKNVQMRDESGDNFIYMAIPSVFHLMTTSRYWHRWKPVVNKSWSWSFFVSTLLIKTDKELQTGSVQNKSIRNGRKNSRFLEHLCPLSSTTSSRRTHIQLGLLSHTWDHSLTVNTAYRSTIGTEDTS